MKKLVSLILSMIILIGMMAPITVLSVATNLLADGGFETNTEMSTGNSWTFKNGTYPWYQYGGGIVSSDMAVQGTKAASFSKGVIGQRVNLEADKKYHLTAQIYTTSATTVKMGFHNGTAKYPNDAPIIREDITLDNANEWETISLDFDSTKTQEYVVAFYNDKKVQMYIDDVTLTEITKPEFSESETERITIQDKTITKEKLTYNVVISSGTQGTLITTLYVEGSEPRVVDTRTSGTEIQTITIPLSEDEICGRAEFSLVDSADKTMTLSLPTVTQWDTTQHSSSQITLNFKTYPLYVGNKSTTDFADWDDYGASVDLVAAVIGEYSKNDIIWTVSDKEVVSITEEASNKSKVSIKGRRTGYAIVTASLPDGTSTSCYIPVIDNYNRLQMQRIVLNTDTLNLAAGTSATLKAILYPKNVLDGNPVKVDTSLIWESSNNEIAAVDEKGTITAISAGTAKITVTSKDVGRTAVCSITVTDSIKTTGITPIQNETVNISVGDTTQLTANVDGTSPVMWKSENSYIADVDENGLIRAYSNSNIQEVYNNGSDVREKQGTVKIYATTADGGYIAEYNICVSDAPTSIHSVSINEESISIPNGATQNLTAVVTPSMVLDKNIQWESSHENIVTVTPTEDTIYGAAQATLTATGEGTATITAKYKDKKDTCTVTVTNGIVKVRDISLEAEKAIDIDEVYRFTPQTTKNATDDKLIWLNTDEDIATIDRDGNVMGYTEGEITVYAIAKDSLTDAEIQTIEDLKYDTRAISKDETAFTTLKDILTHSVYNTCTLTVQNPDGAMYLRNLHIPDETITDNSVSLLWNRASLVSAADIDKYIIYQNGTKIAETNQLAYTVDGLEAGTSYTFKIEAYKTVTEGDKTSTELVKTDEITTATKPAPTEMINVLDYGAKGNGLVTDTYAIQRAINDCPSGGMVWLPGDGHIYYSGALFLKSDITFKVDGVLLGSIDPKDYPNMITRWEGWRKIPQTADEWANTDIYTKPESGKYKQIIKENHYQHSSLINAGTYDEGNNSEISPFNAENITICGEGMINGNGFTLAVNEGPNLPTNVDRVIKDQSLRGRSILIQNAQNIYMKDVMVAYSPSWTIHTIYCDKISIGDISVISLGNGNVGAGYNVPSQVGHIRNGDGIDPDSCTNMNMYNSYFRTGDDVITLKSGRNKEGNDLDKPNAYIRVTDCYADSSIGGYGSGSEVAAGSHDVLFQNLYLESTDCYGVWYKTHPARGGLTENMQARDCITDGGRSVARVNYDFSLESAKPAQTINRADNTNKRYQTKARYLTYENVGGVGWTGTNRYTYDMYGLRNNTVHIDKGMPSNISIDHVTIRNANISGNLDCELVKCNSVRIWDIVSGVNWKQNGSNDVVINTDGVYVPDVEEPDGKRLIYTNFSSISDSDATWGFVTNGTGMDNASTDTSNKSLLLTNGNSPSGKNPYNHAYQLKTFGDDIKSATKLHVLFKYRNTASASSSGNNSGLVFTDSKGQIVFAINGGSNQDEHRKFLFGATNGGKGIDAELKETNGYPTYTPYIIGTDRGSWYYNVDLEIDFTKTVDNVKVIISRTDTGEEVVHQTLTADGTNLKNLYAINYGNNKAAQRITDFGIYDISEPEPSNTPDIEPTPTNTPDIDTKPKLIINSAYADNSERYYNLGLSTGEKCIIIASSYNQDGTLYSVSTSNAENSPVDIMVKVPYEDADVKLMAWDSLEKMNPLTSVVNGEITEIETKYIVAEDFSDVTDSTWGFNGSNTAKVCANISDVQSSQAAGIEKETVTMLLGANSRQYVERTLGNNVSSRNKLNVSFDWQSNILAHASKAVPRNGFFSLMDDDGNCIISMYAHILNGIKYSLDKNTVEISYKDHDNKNTTQLGFTNLIDLDTHSINWYHIELDLDFTEGTVKGTIKDRASGEVKAVIDAKTGAKSLSKLYAYNGYSAAPMSLDNIYIKGGDGVDTLSLKSAVKIYSVLDENNYQEYGIDDFKTALDNAKTVLNDDSAEQAKVNSAYASLVKSVQKLRTKEIKENNRTIIEENSDWIFVKEKETMNGADVGIIPSDNIDLVEWDGVKLPHTWNAQDGSDGGAGGVPDYDRTKGWYRKSMYIDTKHDGKQLYMEFGSAGTACELYINGKHVPYAKYDIYKAGNSIEYMHKGGFSKFRFDITDYVDYGENNDVAVMVDNTKVPEIAPLNGDFNCQGGLYRNVKLIITDDVHFDMSDYGSDGVYLTPQKVTAADDDTNTDFTLEAKARIVNDSAETKTLTINASLCEPSEFEVPDNGYIKEHLRFDPSDMYTEGGAVVQNFEVDTITLGAGDSYEYKKEITVTKPHLWNGIDDPYRYEVKINVSENGAVKDELSVYTGFRYYRIPAPEIDGNGNITGGGFYLNGREYTLRGAGKHQDWGRGEDALGYGVTEENLVSDAGIMYELGMNSVRLVHYQHANEEIDLYDKLGITVWSEVGVVDEILSPNDSNYDKFMNVTKAQMTELIKQQYNHPSIVVWGLGNEIRREMSSTFTKTAGDDANSPNLAVDYHEQVNSLVKELDPNRQTTYAAFCLFNRTKDWDSDTATMNLYPYWYTNGMDKWYLNQKSMSGIMTADLKALNGANSTKPLGISEYGAGGETGFLRPYEKDGTVKAGTTKPDDQWSTTFQAYLHEKIYNEIVNDLPWAWCSYVWQLFDSASDKKQGGLPGTNDKGLVSYDHTTKKDAFYFYKANWNDFDPFIHIVESESTDILRVYSNYDKLQLYVNDEPVGEPITDMNAADGVADSLGIFMWYSVPKGEVRIEAVVE